VVFHKRRCIAPMDAFYERDKRKKPLAFALTDGTPFAVAGSITVSANDLVGTIHDRTPATLRSRNGLWARRTIFAEGEDFFSSLCYSI
jgi:putative SOS response-associated peptidase YedK